MLNPTERFWYENTILMFYSLHAWQETAVVKKKQPVSYPTSTIFRVEGNLHPKGGDRKFLHNMMS